MQAQTLFPSYRSYLQMLIKTVPCNHKPLSYGIPWDDMGVNGILQKRIDLFKIILRILY